jgi:hypothetical protein
LLSRLGQSVRDSGVGLSGMCERLNELRGDLEITSADPGMRLRAIVPLSSQAVAHALPTQLLTAAATNRAIYQPWGIFMARAGKLPALTRSAWAGLNRAKRIPLNVGRWETARGCSAGNSLLDWLHRSPPPSPPRVSGASSSRYPSHQRWVESRVRGRLPEPCRGGCSTGTSEVRYFSDDVTVRYFTPQPPPQRVSDRNIRVR